MLAYRESFVEVAPKGCATPSRLLSKGRAGTIIHLADGGEVLELSDGGDGVRGNPRHF